MLDLPIMARIARVVAPGFPHHVTQRGNRRQKTFFSDKDYRTYLLAAVRYVERNPVRAGLVTVAEKWPWSSASAHGSWRDDLLVKVAPMLERIGDWVGYLAAP